MGTYNNAFPVRLETGPDEPRIRPIGMPTWDSVLALLRSRLPGAMCNAEIAAALECDRNDVTQLTRLMANAGAIQRLTPIVINGGPAAAQVPYRAFERRELDAAVDEDARARGCS